MSPIGRQSGEKEFRVSATLFTTYLKCPQQALARVRGIYPEYTVAAFRGTLAHSIFARHLVDGPIGEADFETACRQQVGSGFGSAMASLSMKPSQFRTVVAEVGELYERFKTVSQDGFSGSEVTVDAQTDDGFELRGRIDAVFVDDGEVRIVDWKTGAYLDDAMPQLEFYSMMWSKANGALPATAEALSLKTGERRLSHPTKESVSQTEQQVTNMIAAISEAMDSDGDLARTAGPHCRWCPILEDCGEGETALKILD